MSKSLKSKSVTQVITCSNETTIVCSENIEIRVYPHCVLPEHYFELALRRLERNKDRQHIIFTERTKAAN